MKTIKSLSFYFLIFVTLVVCSTIESHASDAVKASKQDRKAIEKYVKRNYGKQYHAKYIAGGTNDKALISRKGGELVYVEQFRTRSNGKTGIVISGPCKGYVVGYARRQGKGKTVVTYLVYSPYSNAMDDITAIVTKGKIR